MQLEMTKTYLFFTLLLGWAIFVAATGCSDDVKQSDTDDSDTISGTSGDSGSTDSSTTPDTHTDTAGNETSGDSLSGTDTGGDTGTTVGSDSGSNDSSTLSDTETQSLPGTDSTADTSADTTADSSTAAGTDPGTDSSEIEGTDSSGWFDDGTCNVTACQGHVYACGDCLDNDSDSVVDSRDANCLGPCDNNESGFNMEIPGGNNHPCSQDCYYDQDGGAGNDNCNWDHRCDPLQPTEVSDCKYKDSCPGCTCDDWQASQPATCLDVCGPLTPNGCDCFGCCQLGDTREWRFLGSPGCTVDNIESCDLCTPVGACLNSCGRCELCIGKSTIPADCLVVVTDTDNDTDSDNGNGGDSDIDTDNPNDTDTSQGHTDSDTGNGNIDTDNLRCTPGIQPCGLAIDSPCAPGFYCITGCCQNIVIE